MKRFLKIFSFVLAIVMIPFILPSCGDEESAGFVLTIRNITDDTMVYTEGFYKYQLFDDDTVMITEYTGNETEIVIPATLGGFKVSTVGSSNGYGAFEGMVEITSITIPEGVEEIAACAFYGCTKLETISIPGSVWGIGQDAFTNTPWLQKFENEEFVIVGDSVLIEYNGNALNVVIPDTVKHVGAVFCGNETIKSVVVPNSVYTIAPVAFMNSTVSRVELGNNVLSIGVLAFSACTDLYYINLPDSLKRIEAGAFYSCSSLRFLKFGKSVEYIGEEAFRNASGLNYVYFPKSLISEGQNKYDEEEAKTIETFAFYDTGLTYVFFEGTQAEFDKINIANNPDLADATKVFDYKY